MGHPVDLGLPPGADPADYAVFADPIELFRDLFLNLVFAARAAARQNATGLCRTAGALCFGRARSAAGGCICRLLRGRSARVGHRDAGLGAELVEQGVDLSPAVREPLVVFVPAGRLAQRGPGAILLTDQFDR